MDEPPLGGVGELLTPLRIAGIYAVAGGAWIAFSDRLLAVLVADPGLYTQLQTAKGWLFVALSAGLLFALVRSRERRLASATRETERALRQAGVLHRVLRHNLRNVCNVIQGNTELLAAADGGTETASVAVVREQTDRLVQLSEKTKTLQDVLRAPGDDREQDLAALLREETERLRERHPGVSVDLEVPNSAVVVADEYLPMAVREVLGNAVQHHDDGAPSLQVSVEHRPDGDVRLDIADDGPGIPQIERDVLEAGVERPMFHSEGLGLWLVRTVVVTSGGDVRIVDNEPRGSVVRLTLRGPERVSGGVALFGA